MTDNERKEKREERRRKSLEALEQIRREEGERKLEEAGKPRQKKRP